jgi:hypothetical protein
MEHIYRQIPDLVRVIISEDGDGSHGHPLDVAKTKDRPQGIPLWKVSASRVRC